MLNPGVKFHLASGCFRSNFDLRIRPLEPYPGSVGGQLGDNPLTPADIPQHAGDSRDRSREPPQAVRQEFPLHEPGELWRHTYRQAPQEKSPHETNPFYFHKMRRYHNQFGID